MSDYGTCTRCDAQGRMLCHGVCAGCLLHDQVTVSHGTADGFISVPFPEALTVRNGDTLHIEVTTGDGEHPTVRASVLTAEYEAEVAGTCTTCGAKYTARWRTCGSQPHTPHCPGCGTVIE